MLDFSLGLEPPYITKTMPGIGGRLRVQPEHFVVEEIPLYEPVGEGQHLYVRLTKTGLTTKEIERRLQRLFQLPKGAVGFAGMKDKDAQTTQTFSLGVGYQPPEFADEAAQRIASNLPVAVEWTRFHGNKLRAGHLLGNRFTIVVSDVALPSTVRRERSAAIVEALRKHGLPNYFGPQRFGRGGGNVEQGRAVLRGERRITEKWLRRFMISAYQSFLCNCYLGARVEQDAFMHLMAGDVAKKYDTGGLFVVEDLAAEQARYAAHAISFTAPMFGTKMKAAEGDAAKLEAAIFAQSGITEEQLARQRIEGTRRLGRLLVPDLAVEMVDDLREDVADSASGSSVRVQVSLPKGAFATTVLRELMKTEIAALPDSGDEE